LLSEYSNNLSHLHDPYSLITELLNLSKPDDTIVIKTNVSNTGIAVYKKGYYLKLYLLPKENKDKIKEKPLLGKDFLTNNRSIHSLEFNKNGILLAACKKRIWLWDQKGNKINETHTDSFIIKRTYFSNNGDKVISVLEALPTSRYSIFIIHIMTNTTQDNYHAITDHLTIPQALILKKLSKSSKTSKNSPITPLEELTLQSLPIKFEKILKK
jgi:hypothetical protein